MAPARHGPQPPASSPHAAPELVRAREILADGRWHSYDELVRQLVPLITPGRASRAAEQRRDEQARRRARRRGEPEERTARVRPRDPDRLRETGARILINKMFHGAGFEIDPPGRGRAAGKRVRDPRARRTGR